MDNVSNFLTVLRNGAVLKKKKVSYLSSGTVEGIADILKQEGFIESYQVVEDPVLGSKKKSIFVYLKYGSDGESLLHDLKRISKPGKRVYVGYSEIRKIRDGFGISVLSSHKGIISSRYARTNKVGGELLCEVW